MNLGQKFPKRQVILVSKDINMRIKARALGLEAQDYFNDKVLEDTDLLYTGTRELPADFWDKPRQGHEVVEAGQPHALPGQRPALPRTCWSTSSSGTKAPQPFQAIVREGAGKTAELER